MLTITLDGYHLRFGERFTLSFQRTLRIPDDGRVYPLPPGLDTFPLKSVDDYPDKVPASWIEQGGYFIPMYQREAMWLSFEAAAWKPNAVKIGIGRVNALTGEAFDLALHADPQDYLVCPNQPWLDGFKTGEDVIRQFVAMPLGQGYTVEGQLTGGEESGGMQIVVFEPKPGRFPDQPPPETKREFEALETLALEAMPAGQMGLAAGGRMDQKIYPDPHGIDAWDQENYGALCVYIVNSEQYQELTGELPPPTPVSAQLYQAFDLPWFDLYDEALGDINPAEKLKGIKSVKEIDEEKEKAPGEDETSLDVKQDQIKKIKPS